MHQKSDSGRVVGLFAARRRSTPQAAHQNARCDRGAVVKARGRGRAGGNVTPSGRTKKKGTKVPLQWGGARERLRQCGAGAGTGAGADGGARARARKLTDDDRGRALASGVSSRRELDARNLHEVDPGVGLYAAISAAVAFLVANRPRARSLGRPLSVLATEASKVAAGESTRLAYGVRAECRSLRPRSTA
jgi:hypothetical protein